MDLFSQKHILESSVDKFTERLEPILSDVVKLDFHERVAVINAIRSAIHQVSPFKSEPVDLIQWIASDSVQSNDYNPNSVAPPEMRLLEHSITEDGYTQPIVAWPNADMYEVVDGFHRNRVGKESTTVRRRVNGYLPLTIINQDRREKSDRIAATIRHNRARGKHKVEAMSDIVVELKRRNWSDDKIGRELGMDPDEVLRLTQITGLAELFKDQEFSMAWDIEKPEATTGGEFLSDIAEGDEEPSNRIFHTWEKWECYRAGFYEERPEGMTQDQGEELYREFLSDPSKFETALKGVTTEWNHSCQHYLSNERMNRIAWLGQASLAYAHRIPSCCRGGYHRLTDSQKRTADLLALQYLNLWLAQNGRAELTLEQAAPKTQADLY